jgi:hypothetical protein
VTKTPETATTRANDRGKNTFRPSPINLIDHNDIVEMLRGPIYIERERESP